MQFYAASFYDCGHPRPYVISFHKTEAGAMMAAERHAQLHDNYLAEKWIRNGAGQLERSGGDHVEYVIVENELED